MKEIRRRSLVQIATGRDTIARHLIRQSLVLLVGATMFGVTLMAQRPKAASTDRTLVVMLGTGNPSIDPDRSGPAAAIVVKHTAYLVDFGAGVVRRAQEAVFTREV